MAILVIFASLFAPDLTFTKQHHYIFLHFLNEDLRQTLYSVQGEKYKKHVFNFATLMQNLCFQQLIVMYTANNDCFAN